MKQSSSWVAPSYWKTVLWEERDRLFLWVPVLFGGGISFYFHGLWQVSFPFLGWLWVGSGILIFLSWKVRLPGMVVWMGLFISFSGFTAIAFRTESLNTRLFQEPGQIDMEMGQVVALVKRVQGWHADIVVEQGTFTQRQRSKKGQFGKNKTFEHKNRKRIVKTNNALGNTFIFLKNVKIRVFLKGVPPFGLGDRLKGVFRVKPMLSDSCFGGFSLRRHAYYEKLSGYAELLDVSYNRQILDPINPPSFFSKFRHFIDCQLRQCLLSPQAAIASALITGNRYAIESDIVEAFSISGLSHVLAISGLHMSLIAGLIFFLTQSILKVSKPIFRFVYGAKIAALLTVSLAFVYLGLSGFSLSAMRAFLMTCFVLMGLIASRQVLSLRSVALAALLILIFFPESLVNPSFSLSFAAVTALIAGFESFNFTSFIKKERFFFKNRLLNRLMSSLWAYGGGIFVSSCLATVSTLPLLLFYFQNLSLLGLVSNFIGIPLVAFWILPCGFLGTVLAPFGLHAYPYKLMGLGIEVLVSFIQGLIKIQGMTWAVAQLPESFLIATLLGALWLIIWKKPWRFLGVVGPVAGLILWGTQTYPDIMVTQDGEVLGVRHQGCLYGGSLLRNHHSASLTKYDRSSQKRKGSAQKLLNEWKRRLGCKTYEDLPLCSHRTSTVPCCLRERKHQMTLVCQGKRIPLQKLLLQKGTCPEIHSHKVRAFRYVDAGKLQEWNLSGGETVKKPWD